jgi:hypothetical protein
MQAIERLRLDLKEEDNTANLLEVIAAYVATESPEATMVLQALASRLGMNTTDLAAILRAIPVR